MPLFAAKQMTDGKAQVSPLRQPLSGCRGGIMSQYAAARTRLKGDLRCARHTQRHGHAEGYTSSFSPSVDAVTGT